jgi:hypothetical protein
MNLEAGNLSVRLRKTYLKRLKRRDNGGNPRHRDRLIRIFPKQKDGSTPFFDRPVTESERFYAFPAGTITPAAGQLSNDDPKPGKSGEITGTADGAWI